MSDKRSEQRVPSPASSSASEKRGEHRGQHRKRSDQCDSASPRARHPQTRHNRDGANKSQSPHSQHKPRNVDSADKSQSPRSQHKPRNVDSADKSQSPRSQHKPKNVDSADKSQSPRSHHKPRNGDSTDKKKKNTPKKPKYEPYWDARAVDEGLKRGQLIKGALRVNPKNYQDSYVPHPDGHSDVYISGMVDRNRSFNTDIVAVFIYPPDKWKVLSEENGSPEQAAASAKMTECECTTEGKTDMGNSENMSSSAVTTVNAPADTSSGTIVKSIENLLLELKTDKPGRKSEQGAQCSQSKEGALSNVGAEVSQDGGATQDKNTQNLDDFLRTGKVVFILERKNTMSCCGHLRPMADNNPRLALFSPTDPRMPRIQIPIQECPPDFLERPDIHANTLFVARISEWNDNSNFPRGHLARSLGEAGTIKPETEGILIENNVDDSDFSPEVLSCLPSDLPWSIPPAELTSRRDLRNECIFSIDPATARDLDDALHCTALGDGLFEVGVHIADVSYFVRPHTALDRVAADRATSVYLVQKVVPMLPRLLCEQLCSLNPDQERLTFSVVWKITEEGEVLDEWFGRSVIRSCAKLSYDHAQGFIEEPEREWRSSELPPISGGFSISDISRRVLQLCTIARNLRRQRFDSGALRLNQVKLQFSLDQESGLPNGYSVYKQRDSNRLVEEFMLLANMAVAHHIHHAHPDLAVLRRHPPPQTRMINDLVAVCRSLGVAVDGSSAGALMRSLEAQTGDDLDDEARTQILTALFSKPMQLAVYFCAGSIDDETLYRHYALNVPLYTHFTSPIRRYADVMVHRLLSASLGQGSPPDDDLAAQCSHCNDKKAAAKRVQELSSEMFFAVFVKECGPLEEAGMVIAVLDKSFDVLLLRLGVTKRVYLAALPIKSSTYSNSHKHAELTLTWEVNGSEVTQTITIFTRVQCMVEEGDKPLKWNVRVHPPLP